MPRQLLFRRVTALATSLLALAACVPPTSPVATCAHPPATCRALSFVARTARPLCEGDLSWLRPVLGPARVIGLGEVTHGGDRESYALKRRLIDALDVSAVLIERNVAEMERVNRYVLGQEPAWPGLLDAFYPWKTAEMRDFLDHLRTRNARGGRPIQFLGFDMQSPGALRLLAARLPATRSALGTEALALLDALAPGRPIDDAILERAARWLAAARPHLPASDPALRPLLSSLEQYLRVIPLWRARDRRLARRFRDDAMAANVLLQLERLGPGARVALWAHNGHLATTPTFMGGTLRERLGPAYAAIGLLGHHGTYRAGSVGPDGRPIWRPSLHQLPPAPAGSIEALLRASGRSCLALPLRHATPGSAGDFLATNTHEREVGALHLPDPFLRYPPLNQRYDVAIFIDQVSPATAPPP